MTQELDELLALTFGKQTVAQNLQKAVESGRLIRNDDGGFNFPVSNPTVSPWLYVHPSPDLNCRFLMRFLFDCAYAQSAVPFGCKQCFKVGLVLDNLRQLMALRKLQEKLPYCAKCGVEVDRRITQNRYSGFFYCTGVNQAVEVFEEVRAAVNDDPKLGTKVPVQIKRGCTEYEIYCGPSDKFEFRPELPRLEAGLNKLLKPTAKQDTDDVRKKLETLAYWVETAFRIGDDTYLDFTGGKRLYPKSVVYDVTYQGFQENE